MHAQLVSVSVAQLSYEFCWSDMGRKSRRYIQSVPSYFGTSGGNFTELLEFRPTSSKLPTTASDTYDHALNSEGIHDDSYNSHKKANMCEDTRVVVQKQNKQGTVPSNSHAKWFEPAEGNEMDDEETDKRLAEYDELFFKYGGKALENNKLAVRKENGN
ncbi:hypothetical protein BGX38DRAFT_1144117 [Terfezia claveryi]|nr:hypothetical protein BGX38DRAFT_1144117 [Terfezia claveryi]